MQLTCVVRDTQHEAVSTPSLSVIVIAHDMARELPRTLASLAASYQRDIEADEYEIVVVDNGSRVPVDAAAFAGLDCDVRLVRIDSAPPSPAYAINRGLSEVRGDVIGLLIDGARLLSPGVLHFARCGARLYPRAIVATLGWYLGADFQSHSVLAGYDAREEDALLDSIAWPEHGYRLFEISTPDESSVDGLLVLPGAEGPAPPRIYESNALFAGREIWEQLGGADERFTQPGGGLLNFDLFKRALELPDARLVLLLGEATFHQIHGGIATNATPAQFRQRYGQWAAEYRSIRGAPFSLAKLTHAPTCLGTLHPAARQRLARAVIDPTRPWPQRPLGPGFDLWRAPQDAAPSDASTAALVDLMHTELNAGRYDAAAVIARMTRAHAAREPEALRLLKYVAPYFDQRAADLQARDARFHLAVGRAHLLLEEPERAAAALRTALERDPLLAEAADALQSCFDHAER